MVPPRWRYEVTEDGKKQFAVIKKLLNAPETAEIIAATDAGREGEHIFRLIYQRSGSKKPVKRLWIRSLTDEAIREGLSFPRAVGSVRRAGRSGEVPRACGLAHGLELHPGLHRSTTGSFAPSDVSRHQRSRFSSTATTRSKTSCLETYYEVHAVLEPGFTAKYVGKDKKDPHR